MSTLLTSHYLTAMDARRLSKLATEAAMSVNGLQLEDDLDAQKEPPSYRDIMPRRAWLPPGAAASSTPASPVGGPPLSPTSPRSPYAVLCPLSPPLPSDTTPPPPPLTPAVRPPPVPPPATPKRASFASLRLVGKDGIRVSGFPTTLFETIETTLQKGWRGVRERRAAGEAFEWTLDGAPCECLLNPLTPGSGTTPAFASHRLIEFILFALSKAGWQVTAAPTLPGQQRDSFIFRSCTPRERVFFTVLFERLSILLLDPPPEVREAWRQVLDVGHGGSS